MSDEFRQAFGEWITKTEGVTNPYDYTGRYLEPGGVDYVHYYRNRYYLPTLGIFSSRDAAWADIHRGWGYVGNMPPSNHILSQIYRPMADVWQVFDANGPKPLLIAQGENE